MTQEQQPQKPRRTLLWVLGGVTAVGALALGGMAFAIYSLANTTPTAEVNQDSFLFVHLDGPLYESPPAPGLFDDPNQTPLLVTDMAMGIREAAEDDRIEGIYLRIEAVSGGWGKFEEVRDAIVDFKASGKPCVAYSSTMLMNQSYYLASACDQIWLAPGALALVNGFASELTYYRGMFDRFGIVPDYLHVGDFKSYIEVYERTGPSESAAAAYEYLLDGMYSHMVDGIATGRGVSEDVVKEWIDSPSLSPDDFVAKGMADGLAFPDAIGSNVHTFSADSADEWAEKVKSTVFQGTGKDLSKYYTSIDDYVRSHRQAQISGDSIAIVHAEGNIMPGGNEDSLFGSSNLTDGKFKAWMQEAREDDDIKAVVVRVNSPGGSGQAADMMWREVIRMKEAGKPVVVSMADYAASGGYYISAPADWVIAQPNTITGSIGVFGGKLTFGGTMEQLGMTHHTFRRGEVADLLSLTAPFSEQGRVTFQAFLDSFYETFLSRVSNGRDMTRDQVHEVAQGRVWTGQQALDRKLVDALGGVDDALVKAAELAELSDYGVVDLPRQKTFMEIVLESLGGANAFAPKVEVPIAGADRVLAEIELLQAIQESGGVAAYLPGFPSTP